MKYFKRFQDVIIIGLLAVLAVTAGCGKDEKPLAMMPWEYGDYSYYEDSTLQRLIDANDTLAAMTLTWHYLNRDEAYKASKLISDFNKFHSTAAPELNYITGMALAAWELDSAALVYLEPIKNDKRFPQIKHLVANSYKKVGRYEDALKIYKKMPDRKSEAIQDSIMICKAEMGDTLSGITYAQKMLKNREIGPAAKYFERYVSKQRGKSPAEWNYGAGEAYFMGNNFTRAQVFLENADAQIDEAHLSNLLGRTYLKLEVFDSCASKLNQALIMGDSSLDNIHTLCVALSREKQNEELMRIAKLGRSLFPKDQRFYFFISQVLYDENKFQELNQMAKEGLEDIPYSFRLYAYLIGSYYLLGEKQTADSLLEVFIDTFEYEPLAMKGAAKFFETSLKDTVNAERLRKLEISDKYPVFAGFYDQYDILLRYNNRDSALVLLNTWIAKDTVEERVKVIRYLKKRDFPYAE